MPLPAPQDSVGRDGAERILEAKPDLVLVHDMGDDERLGIVFPHVLVDPGGQPFAPVLSACRLQAFQALVPPFLETRVENRGTDKGAESGIGITVEGDISSPGPGLFDHPDGTGCETEGGHAAQVGNLDPDPETFGKADDLRHRLQAIGPVMADVDRDETVRMPGEHPAKGLDLPRARVGSVLQPEGQPEGSHPQLSFEENLHPGNLRLVRRLVDVGDAHLFPQRAMTGQVPQVQPGVGPFLLDEIQAGSRSAVARQGRGHSLLQEGLLDRARVVQVFVMHVRVDEARGNQHARCFQDLSCRDFALPRVDDPASLQPEIEFFFRPLYGVDDGPPTNENIHWHDSIPPLKGTGAPRSTVNRLSSPRTSTFRARRGRFIPFPLKTRLLSVKLTVAETSRLV